MSEPSDLQPLVTACPNCSTQFRVSEAQLQVASGKVRCGACLTVFQGVEHLIWDQDDADDDDERSLDDLLAELESDFELDLDAEADKQAALQQRAEAKAEPAADTGGGKPTTPAMDDDAADALAAAVAATFAKPSGAAEKTPELAPDAQLRRDGSSKQEAPDAATEASQLPQSRTDVSPPAAAQPATAAEVPEPASTPAAQVSPEAEAKPASKAEAKGPAQAAAAAQNKPEEPQQAQPGPEPRREVAEAVTALASEAEAEADASEEPDPFERLNANKANELPTPGGQRGWLFYLVIVGGVLGLLAQVLVFRFDAWTQDPSLRPVYTTLCPLVGCTVPPLQALEQMSTQSLTVRSHPSEPGMLMVDTVIVNGAEFAQAFPVLELTFTDINGNQVSDTRFEPSAYLAGELLGAKNIASKTPVRIKLEIADPGPEAVSYKMDFR